MEEWTQKPEEDDALFKEDAKTIYFSFEGVFGRIQFFIVAVTLGGFMDLMSTGNNIVLVVIGTAIVFYAMLAAIQKRSRDMNIGGSLFILLYSLSFPISRMMLYGRDTGNPIIIHNDIIRKSFYGALIGYLIVSLLLVLIPGAKKKDMSKRSPLLKNPPLYFLICVIIYAIVAYFIRDL